MNLVPITINDVIICRDCFYFVCMFVCLIGFIYWTFTFVSTSIRLISMISCNISVYESFSKIVLDRRFHSLRIPSTGTIWMSEADNVFWILTYRILCLQEFSNVEISLCYVLFRFKFSDDALLLKILLSLYYLKMNVTRKPFPLCHTHTSAHIDREINIDI